MIAVKVEPELLVKIRETLVPKAVELKTTNKYEAFDCGLILAS